jgi:hypothetical protein
LPEAGAEGFSLHLEMRRIEQTQQLWTLRQARLKASGMAEPSLPLTLFRLNRETTRIYATSFDGLAAKATWAPFNDGIDCAVSPADMNGII